jgi:hypothetical protein
LASEENKTNLNNMSNNNKHVFARIKEDHPMRGGVPNPDGTSLTGWAISYDY